PRRMAPAPRVTMSLKGTPLGGVTRVALSVETTSIRLMPAAIRVSISLPPLTRSGGEKPRTLSVSAEVGPELRGIFGGLQKVPASPTPWVDRPKIGASLPAKWLPRLHN